MLSQFALFFVLLLSLRDIGVSEQDVSTAEVFAVYAFTRLLSAIPITPGGVGSIDLGLHRRADALRLGGEGGDGRRRAAVPRADVRHPDPDRALTYVIWRAKSGWRRPADVAAQRERVSDFPA